MIRSISPIISIFPLILLAACAANSENAAPATQPAMMSIPVERSNPDYWFKKPAVATVQSADFQKLWHACASTLINDEFEIDQQNYRSGLLTTQPMVSKQYFEAWRSDAGTVHEILQDSLQTIRRTVHVEFVRRPDGTYLAHPKVVKEQSSHPERRITTEAQFTQAFAAVGETDTRTNTEGASVPSRYWYALGRDEAMEKELANSIREKLAAVH